MKGYESISGEIWPEKQELSTRQACEAVIAFGKAEEMQGKT